MDAITAGLTSFRQGFDSLIGANTEAPAAAPAPAPDDAGASEGAATTGDGADEAARVRAATTLQAVSRGKSTRHVVEEKKLVHPKTSLDMEKVQEASPSQPSQRGQISQRAAQLSQRTMEIGLKAAKVVSSTPRAIAKGVLATPKVVSQAIAETTDYMLEIIDGDAPPEAALDARRKASAKEVAAQNASPPRQQSASALPMVDEAAISA